MKHRHNLQQACPARLVAEDGNAVIEFALVTPLLLVLMLGLVETTNMLAQDRKAALAAQTMVDLVARMENVQEAERTELRRAIEAVMLPYRSEYDAMIGYVEFDNDGDPEFGPGSDTFQFIVHGDEMFSSGVGGELATLATGLGLDNDDSVIIGRVTMSYDSLLATPFVTDGVRLGSTNLQRPRTANVTFNLPANAP